jgi:hypothetical protein
VILRSVMKRIAHWCRESDAPYPGLVAGELYMGHLGGGGAEFSVLRFQETEEWGAAPYPGGADPVRRSRSDA